MEIKIIKDQCIGCGSCEAVCPEVFEITDEGIAEVVSIINQDNEELVKEAVEICPTEAIEIIDEKK